jgi:hypothetical protein
MFSVGCRNRIFAPDAVAVAVVAVPDAVDVRAGAVVVPVGVLDAAEAVEAPVDVAGVRIGPARRADQRVPDMARAVKNVPPAS